MTLYRDILKKLKKKKKGLSAIETILGSLVFLLVFVSICDFLVVSNRYLSITDTTKEMARTISVQGGSLTVKPGAFSANYYNIEELANLFKKQMNRMGFEDGEYNMYITYTKIYDETTNTAVEHTDTERIVGVKDDGTYGVIKETEKIEYLSDFTVRVDAVYDWPFTQSIFHQEPTVLTVSMPGLSEWRYAYDGWASE